MKWEWDTFPYLKEDIQSCDRSGYGSAQGDEDWNGLPKQQDIGLGSALRATGLVITLKLLCS